MQDARGPGRTSLRALASSIIAKEGHAALWIGFRVNMVRVVPSCVATFVSYELLARYVNNIICLHCSNAGMLDVAAVEQLLLVLSVDEHIR
jgi:Mitochondrial carrier protein